MKTSKLITNIFFAAPFIIAACTPTTAKLHYADKVNMDTTYSTSTMELESERIPDSVFQMTNLRYLAINGMDCDYGSTNCWQINEIPSNIKNLKNLKELGLTLNAITTIPKELTELSNLKSIDLTDNAGLQDINNLTKLKNLEFLYLYGCRLTKLPDNISDLKNLKELGLVGNSLDKNEQERIKKALPNCVVKF
ncbi:leucine-rich repeat domain-containing protein [Solitalea lacus]|uniref:leucine-rich repeat domain-containing protein n=1 Tax=Solitalea lacus TaxID=2911172 RepID=UPI001EDBF1EE|nr:hypothetical protein [Solitalea lacus]UKJ06307.1 hypothetical protein L2B55_12250 [Solitalea lacus]